MSAVVDTLAPIFVVIAVGAVLRWRKMVPAEFFAHANRLTYLIGLPAMLFMDIATAKRGTAGAGTTATIALVGMVACIGAAYLFAFISRMPVRQVGTFVQSSYRGNLAYIGMALVTYFYASAGPEQAAHAKSVGALALAPIIPLYNVAAVIVLLASQHRISGAAIKLMAKSIVTNPLLLACVAGYIWVKAGVTMPLWLDHSLGAIAQFTLPIALICIGAALVSTPIKGSIVKATMAAFIKNAIAPAVGLLMAWLLKAGPVETAVAMLLLASPTAVTSYVMAEQLGGDGPLAANSIVISTLLSILTLSIVIGLILA